MSFRQLVLVDESGRETGLTDAPLTVGSAYECTLQVDGLAACHLRVSADRIEALDDCLVGSVPLATGATRRLVGAARVEAGRSVFSIVERWNVDEENTVQLGLAFGETASAPRVIVVEGTPSDLERELFLDSERDYLVGRASHAQLALDDVAVSREHLVIRSEDGRVLVRDDGSTRGAFLGTARLEAGKFAVWSPEHMLLVGRTVLALALPQSSARAALFAGIADGAAQAPAATPSAAPEAIAVSHEAPASAVPNVVAPIAEAPVSPERPPALVTPRWRPVDIAVFAAAGVFVVFALIAVVYILL